jgi:2,3-bisphosphoglycerate-independent phosphoglycerate mutase
MSTTLKPPERDPLQEHELELRRELRAAGERGEGAGSVRAVPPHAAAEHSLESEPGVSDAHDRGVAALLPREREVLERHAVRQRRWHHGVPPATCRG